MISLLLFEKFWQSVQCDKVLPGDSCEDVDEDIVTLYTVIYKWFGLRRRHQLQRHNESVAIITHNL